MWPFTCSVCAEKDKRIADLKEMINPPKTAITRAVELEEDMILAGAGVEQVRIPENNSNENAEEQ